MQGMTREIEVAVVDAPGSPFAITSVTLSPCQATEIVVRIVAVGICHTDLAVRDGEFPVPPFPAILGHEGAGIVEEVGSTVTRLKRGDHVVLSFAFCGLCDACTNNMPSRCADFLMENLRGCRADGSHAHHRSGVPLSGHFFGQSSFASYVVTNERQAIRVAPDLSLELLAPLGCGLQTGAGAVLNRLKPRPGSSMAVFGVGTVGLAAIMAAKVAGCHPIVAIDRNPDRLQLAIELGATHKVLGGHAGTLAEVLAATAGGSHSVVEASGSASAIADAIQSIGQGGQVCLLGIAAPGATVQLPVAALMAGTIQTAVEGDSVPSTFIPQLIELHRQGRFPFDRLVRYYDFSEINQAVADSQAGHVVKPVLRLNAGFANGEIR